jgi:Tfp pilus assembly PilM family ATPase/Tfp pilus assembly protein PilN
MNMLETVRSRADWELRRMSASCRSLHRSFRTSMARLVARGPGGTGVIEIGEHLIKVARVVTSGDDPRVAGLIIRRTPPKKDAIPGIVQAAVEQLGLAGASIVAVFPRSRAIVRYISLPSVSEREIERMINLQASKLVPFEKGEAVIQFRIVGCRDDGFSDVMVVIVDRAAVSEYAGWLELAGIEPRLMRLDAECVYDFCSPRGGKGTSAAGDSVSIIDVGSTSTNVVIVHEGRMVFTRSLPFGTISLFPHGKRRGDGMGRFVDQIIDTFASYQKARGGQTISRILLTGARRNEEALSVELSERLSLPVKGLGAESHGLLPDVLDSQTREAADETSLATLIGAQPGGRLRKIDLSPGALKMRRQRRQVRRHRLELGVLGLSILLMALAVFTLKAYRMEAYLAKLDEEIAAVAPVADRIELMHRQTTVIRSQLGDGDSLLDPLAEIHKLFPAQVSLTVLSFEENGQVAVKGVAESMSQVFELVPKLEASDVFNDVAVKYVNQRNVGQKQLIDFQIGMEVSEGGSRP